MSEIPQTRYAQHGDNYIAYQVLGDGPPDIVFMRTAFNHLELQWEEPRFARFLNRLASMGRLIVFDVLGSGLSDPFPSAVVPTIEDWADGLLAVMDTVGSERCVLIAASVAATRAFVFERLYEGPELYDRLRDPRETANLAGRPEHAELERELRDRIFSWLFETSDLVPPRRDPRFDDDLRNAIFGA